MADTWATGCWRARHAPWLIQAVAVAIHVVAVELVAVAATLAAVAAALGCSCGVTVPPFLIGVKFEARVREKTT